MPRPMPPLALCEWWRMRSASCAGALNKSRPAAALNERVMRARPGAPYLYQYAADAMLMGGLKKVASQYGNNDANSNCHAWSD